jgi:ubiquinol-cytochrome c reductase cytochrome b subunit
MVVSDSEQYLEANPFVTPVHIVPEWYFLPAYAILRSVPKKLGGVRLLIGYIVILLLFPFLSSPKISSNRIRLLKRVLFWLFISKFFLLVYLGGSIAEQPYILFSQIRTFFYFIYFIIIRVLKELIYKK